jgi:hypothetical protein
MKNVERDPITGRFVSIKEKALHVTLAPAKERKSKKDTEDTEEIISILSATYGIDATICQVEPENIKVGRKVTNKMAGSDPAPKQKKIMTIKAVVKGVEIEKTFNEGEIISF